MGLNHTSLPEGVYPGCTAVGAIAPPGAGMYIRIPGYGQDIRAIVANQIDGLTNLTVTVDGDRIARVYGVGERVPSIDRTTEFMRRRPRQTGEKALKFAYILRETRGLLHVVEGQPLTVHYRLMLPGVNPITLPFVVTQFFIDPPIVIEGHIYDTYSPYHLVHVSLNRNEPSTVFISFIHEDLTSLPEDLTDGAVHPVFQKHYEYAGGVLSEVSESRSWRSFAYEGIEELTLPLGIVGGPEYQFTWTSAEERYRKVDALFSPHNTSDYDRDRYYFSNAAIWQPGLEALGKYRTDAYYGGLVNVDTATVFTTDPYQYNVKEYILSNRHFYTTSTTTIEADRIATGIESTQTFAPLISYGIDYEYETISGSTFANNTFEDIAVASIILDE